MLFSRVYLLVFSLKFAEAVNLTGYSLEISEYPFSAFLLVPDREYIPHPIHSYEQMDYAVCVASLIHPKWLMSAAHCFDRASRKDYPLDLVVMGIKQLGDVNAMYNTYREYIRHHNYRPKLSQRERKNDIAVIELKRVYELDSYINVVLLPWVVGNYLPLCDVGQTTGIGSTSMLRTLNTTDLLHNQIVVTKYHHDEGRQVFFSTYIPSGKYKINIESSGAFICYPYPDERIAVQYGILSVTDQKRLVYEEVSCYKDFIRKHVPDSDRSLRNIFRPNNGPTIITLEFLTVLFILLICMYIR